MKNLNVGFLVIKILIIDIIMENARLLRVQVRTLLINVTASGWHKVQRFRRTR